MSQAFPLFIKGRCGFARDGKIRSVDKYFSFNADKFDFVDIFNRFDSFFKIISNFNFNEIVGGLFKYISLF